MKRILSASLAAAALTAGLLAGGSTLTTAAPPVVVEDDGAYVRLVGNPDDGTAKFQYGWKDSTAASEAVGYWIGVYDVTNSEYVWVIADEDVELPSEFFRNAKPTPDLPNGEYKVVFFVRGSYGPTTNISEIELYFDVTNSTS